MKTVSLADVRLLNQARSGDPAAVRQLWTQWRTPMWSVCRSMAADKAEAVALLQALYAELPLAVRGWARDEPMCCLVGTWVFRRVSASLELERVAGIEVHAPQTVCAPTRADAAVRIARLSPPVRLVYLVDLFFGCPASTTAALLGVDELDLRHARSAAAWSVVAGGAS